MKPWRTLERAPAPDGGELVLQERDGQFVIRVAGHELMSSRQHGSEEALAEAGCAPLASKRGARVCVGGLGLGYTLRAALDHLGPDAEVWVAELLTPVVAWNRGPLAPLAGAPLADPRVRVHEGDVGALLEAQPAAFDAVLLDVDNGPAALTRAGNAGLYGPKGLARVRRALRPRGVVVVWSAAPDARFLTRLREAGFEATAREVPARGGVGRRGTHHTLFVGRC